MKKYAFLFLLSALLFSAPLLLKADSPKEATSLNFYKCFEGTINNKYKITMHLIKKSEGLNGYYYYQSQRIPLWLTGSIDINNNIIIRELTREGKETGFFAGKFIKPDSLTGTWQSPDKKKQFPFSLKEKYGKDSLQFTVCELREKQSLIEGQESPQVTTDLFYLYPSKYKNPAVLAKVRELVLPGAGKDPQARLKALTEEFFKEYKEQNKDIYDPEQEPMFNWESFVSMSLLLNEKDILTFGMSYYSYSGGAHGLSGNGFVVADLLTGKQITLDDVFTPGYQEALGKILEKALRKQENIPDGDSLADHNFFVDKIMPNENFYLTLDGIGFYYNIYEIKPYVEGPTDIFLSFKEIKKLLKPKSPVRRLFE
jgi:hypothetical protein